VSESVRPSVAFLYNIVVVSSNILAKFKQGQSEYLKDLYSQKVHEVELSGDINRFTVKSNFCVQITSARTTGGASLVLKRAP